MSRSPISSMVFVSIIVALFGFGTLWVGEKGMEIAFPSYRVNYKQYIATTTAPKKVAPTFNDSINLIADNIVSGIKSVNFPHSELVIIVGGDVMMDRNVRKFGELYGYSSLFEDITPLFRSADISVVNLEGPITKEESKTLLPNGGTTGELQFTFSSEVAAVLKNSGAGLVSLANNHTDNFGIEGFNETKFWLDAAGVTYFGDPWNSSSTKVLNKKGVPVAFVGYNQFQTGFDRVIAEVKALSKDGNFVIVMPHWGEEYVKTPSELLKRQATELVRAGAGAVIGSHPHVIMPHEFIGDVPVFYSLGNLLFDQYFSDAVMNGEVLKLVLTKSADDKVSIKSLELYKTSTATRKKITVDLNPIEVAEKTR